MFATATADIRAKIETDWTETPLKWPNETFEPPASGAWIFVEFMGSGSIGSNIGSAGKRVYQDSGIVVASVMYPTHGDGDEAARDLAQAFGDMLRTQKIGSAQTEAPTIATREPGSDDGNWWRISAVIPFTVSYFA